MKRPALLQNIRKLTEVYTAPFAEQAVSSRLHNWLDTLKLTYEMDAYGNTWVRVRRGQPRRHIVFAAHLDHPAFGVAEVKGSTIQCIPLGNLPAIGVNGTKIIFPRTGAHGRVVKSSVDTINGRKKTIAATIKLSGKTTELPRQGDAAVFDFPGVKPAGNRLKLRAADDLMGCVAIVAALDELARNDKPVDAIGIFTRAEEVGFFGAIGVAMDKRLPHGTYVVSVECSKAYGEIELGKGPVVRLGDRSGPFDPRVCALVSGAARACKDKTFVYQSALMAGGTCEATAFLAFGYPAGGIALPLGAYHNQGPKGVAPEEIDIRDLERASILIRDTAWRAGAGVEDLDLLRNDLINNSNEGRNQLRGFDPIYGEPINVPY